MKVVTSYFPGDCTKEDKRKHRIIVYYYTRWSLCALCFITTRKLMLIEETCGSYAAESYIRIQMKKHKYCI